MNIILLGDEDFKTSGVAVLRDRRHVHIKEILKPEIGDMVRVGIINGKVFNAEISAQDPECTELHLKNAGAAPPRPNTDVIMAMVRPRIVRQILISLTSLGVRNIFFVNAWKVPKPYFSQRLFDGNEYKDYLYIGLEQSCQTYLPNVSIHRRFNHFIEEELEKRVRRESRRWVAHPGGGTQVELNHASEDNHLLAFGPEGGWTEGEVQLLEEKGFKRISLGPRILRVETAVPYLFGRLGI